MIALIPWPKSDRKRGRGRPFVYLPTSCNTEMFFVVRIWLRMDSNRALHSFQAMDYYYPYNRKVLLKARRLTSLPDRTTFDRRLANMSIDIKEAISTIGNMFVKEEFVDPYIVCEGSTLLKAKGHLGNKQPKEIKHMLRS
jgi:hypothetical protein